MEGPAGSGKTTLVGRLRQEIMASRATAGNTKPLIFSWIRFDAGAGRLWYFLRRWLFTDLLRPVHGKLSQLDEVLQQRLPEVFGAGSEQDFFDYFSSTLFAGGKYRKYKEHLYQLCQINNIGRDLREVLLHLHGPNASIARDYLVGEEQLPDQEVLKLGIQVNSAKPDRWEQESQPLVLSLCRLIGRQFPLILCFDQIDILPTTTVEAGLLGRFVDLVGQLRDQAGSAKLLISFVLSETHDKLRAAAGNEALWKRMAAHKINLSPLNWEAAEAITLDRLRSNSDLGKARADHSTNRFWPFEEARLRKFYETESKQTCTPRQWLEICQKEFERLRDAQKPDLHHLWEARLQTTKVPAADRFDEMLEEGLELLARLLAPLVRVVPPEEFPTNQSHLQGFFRSGVNGACLGVRWFGNAPPWQTLDSLAHRWDKDALPHLVLLFRDSRKGLKTPVSKRVTQLEGAEAKAVFIQPEQARYLHAVVELLREAKEGKAQAQNGAAVSEQDFVGWIQTQLKSGPGVLGAIKELQHEVFGELLDGLAADVQSLVGQLVFSDSSQ